MNDTDPAEAREALRTRWRQRGESWTKAAPEGASVDDEMNQNLIEAAGCKAGDHMLDIAGGNGEPTISVALHVGPSGRVSAVDLAAEMQVGALRRAAALELSNIGFAVCDMEHLAFPDNIFDAVTCRFGIMFPPDRAAAAAEAHRVLKPGAKAAYLVWGPEEDNTIHRTLTPAVLTHLGKPLGPPPPRHVLGASGALNALLAGAGFAATEELEFRNSRVAAEGERFWGRTFDRNFGAVAAAMNEAGQGALEQAMWDAFAGDRVDGGYRIESHARIGVGTKAG